LPGESITKPTTVQQFLKTRSGLRVEASAVDHFLTTVDELAGRVADKATEIAKAEQRTTMLERDVIEGFKAVVGTPGQVDPASVFRQLDALDTDSLARVINLIQEWLEARKP
jgi:histone H3/H4